MKRTFLIKINIVCLVYLVDFNGFKASACVCVCACACVWPANSMYCSLDLLDSVQGPQDGRNEGWCVGQAGSIKPRSFSAIKCVVGTRQGTLYTRDTEWAEGPAPSQQFLQIKILSTVEGLNQHELMISEVAFCFFLFFLTCLGVVLHEMREGSGFLKLLSFWGSNPKSTSFASWIPTLLPL